MKICQRKTNINNGCKSFLIPNKFTRQNTKFQTYTAGKNLFETWRRRRFSGLNGFQAIAEALIIGFFISSLRWIHILQSYQKRHLGQRGEFNLSLKIQSKNILNSIRISVLFFNFENNFLVFSRNIQLHKKPSTSPETEGSSGSRKCFSFNFHKFVQELSSFIPLGRVISGCF